MLDGQSHAPGPFSRAACLHQRCAAFGEAHHFGSCRNEGQKLAEPPHPALIDGAAFRFPLLPQLPQRTGVHPRQNPRKIVLHVQQAAACRPLQVTALRVQMAQNVQSAVELLFSHSLG